MANEQLEVRHIYQTVFQTREGKAVLADMLNDLGFFATDQNYIKPELTAFANQLLQKLGINVIQNISQRIDAMIDCSTDRDVVQEVENE